jgi:hypothetical protein
VARSRAKVRSFSLSTPVRKILSPARDGED